MSSRTVDLNYNFDYLVVFPQGTYPDDDLAEKIYCFHTRSVEITRREDYHTFAEYWTLPYDRYATYGTYKPGSDCPCESFDYKLHGHGSSRPFSKSFRIYLGTLQFQVCRSSPYGFAPFFSVSRTVLSDLGTLTVRLDGELVESVEIGGRWERFEKLLPLKLYSRHGKNGMEEWEKMVRRLAENIRHNHLTLRLIVSVTDITSAKTVLKPLDRLPMLKNCGIWLNKHYIPELKTIAMDTVKRLTSSTQTRGPFRYLDLSIEIRWKILEYSDLVYDRAIGWRAPLPKFWKIPSPYCSCENELDRDTIVSGIHLPDCSRYEMDGNPSWFLRVYISLQTLCIFVKSPSTTKNWRPSSLPSQQASLPRRSFHLLPMNRFFIIPPYNAFGFWYPDRPESDPERIVIPMPRLELSLFLSSLTRNALRNIRYLEWILPQFENYTTAPRSAYFDYLDTIEMMAQAMVLPQLTLVLDLRGGIKNEGSMEYNRLCWLNRVASNGKVYDRVLHPLRRLEGLKDFFVYLRRIHRKFAPVCYSYDNDEMRYEKAVMGEEYDSRTRGKPQLARFERDCGDSWGPSGTTDLYVDYDPDLDR